MSNLFDICSGLIGLLVMIAVFFVIPKLMKNIERNPETWSGGGDVGHGDGA